MDKFEKRAPNRYYDDILNVEYRVGSQDRFSDSKSVRGDAGRSESETGYEAPRRHQ